MPKTPPRSICAGAFHMDGMGGIGCAGGDAMTPMQLARLCAFVNMPVPPGARGSLGAICQMLADGESSAGQISKDDGLCALRLEDVVDHNDTTGFVAYALCDSLTGQMYGLFRGSETARNQAGVPVDWTDNILSPLFCSGQYGDAADFAARFQREEVTFIGHSKGGHNALFALSAVENPRARAMAFNGQGFARGQLSREQIRRLREQAENLVVQNDPVGALLWHPERRKFVRYSGKGMAHSLSAFSFAADGQPVPGFRPVWSYLLEAASRLAVRALRTDGETCPVPAG